jgi:hypothetical protein
MGEMRGAYMVWWRALMEMDHLEELGQDGRRIFKRVSKKWG